MGAIRSPLRIYQLRGFSGISLVPGLKPRQFFLARAIWYEIRPKQVYVILDATSFSGVRGAYVGDSHSKSFLPRPAFRRVRPALFGVCRVTLFFARFQCILAPRKAKLFSATIAGNSHAKSFQRRGIP